MSQFITANLVAKTPIERGLFCLVDPKRSTEARLFDRVMTCALLALAALSVVFLPLVIAGIFSWQKLLGRIAYYSTPAHDPIDPALRNQKHLVCKVGNSHLVLAVFEGDKITEKSRFDYKETDWAAQLQEKLGTIHDLQGALIGSVNNRVIEDVNRAFAAANVQHIAYDKARCKLTFAKQALPADMGLDLIANIYAALKTKRNTIIGDIGTALTVTAVDAEGDVKAVYIEAGMPLKTNSFTPGTDIPPLALRPPVSRPFPGSHRQMPDNTIQCISDGVYWGLVGGFTTIERVCRANAFPEPSEEPLLIATGGVTSAQDDISLYQAPNNTSEILRKDLKQVGVDIIDPDLTLTGLHEMLLEQLPH